VPTFYNQALNTFFNYCVRASGDLLQPAEAKYFITGHFLISK
jgi:hypothetical protein